MAVKDSWVYGSDKGTIVLPGGKPTRTKKITGTRLGAVLGLNVWKTPFQAFCEITKIAEPPFEGNMYTAAGIAIESKLIQWVRDELDTRVLTPEEYWGALYEQRKYGFFPDEGVFDGMWDGIEVDVRDEQRAIVECKTTKRAQDWIDGPPAYYLVQALLYAHLQGVKKVIFSAAFLEEADYAHPENFVCTEENTALWFFDVDDTAINVGGQEYTIVGLMDLARRWYDEHVMMGMSPQFDEKKDKDYLAILRTHAPANDSDLDGLLTQIAVLEASIATARREANLDEAEKALAAAKKSLKPILVSMLRDGDPYVDAGTWRLTRGEPGYEIDEDALRADGLYDKYAREVEGTTRLAHKPKSAS